MGLFSKGGFFDKVTRGIDKATGGVAGTVFNVAKTVVSSVAPLAVNLIPGVGPVLGAVLTPVLAGLSASQQAEAAAAIAPAIETINEDDLMAIANAVKADGVIEVNEIEETVLKQYPSIDAATLVTVAKSVTSLVQLLVPNVTINDTKALANISFTDKLKGFFGKYKWYLLGGIAGCAGLFFFMKKGNRRRW